MSKEKSYIATISGRKMYPFNPEKSEIDIEDIAHALSRICRYNGHLNYHYSVAEHSLNVAEELKLREASKELRLYGLLHDASEAYISDIPRPLKKYLLEYGAIELWMQMKIMDKVAHDIVGEFEISDTEQMLLNKVDYLLSMYEAQKYMGKYDWNKCDEKLNIELRHPMSCDVAKHAFLNEFYFLIRSI